MGIEWKRLFLNKGVAGSLIVLVACNMALFFLMTTGTYGKMAKDTTQYRITMLEELREGTLSFQELDELMEKAYVLQCLNNLQEEAVTDPEFYEMFGKEEEEELRRNYPELAAGYDEGKYDLYDMSLQNTAAYQLKISAEYCEHFDEKLEEIQKQAESIGRIPIFQNATGATKNNVTRTVSDYSRLDSIGDNLSYGNDSPVTNFLSYGMEPLFGLVFAIIFVKKMLEENQWGLRPLVFATKKGRIGLTVWRFAAIFLGAVISSLCLFGSTLAESIYFFGGVQPGRLAQSLPLLADFTYPMRIGTLLCLYLIAGCGVQMLVMTVVWFFFAWLEQSNISILAVAAAFGVSGFAYGTIPYQSVFSWLKYMNLYALLDFHTLLQSYRNLGFGPFLIEKTEYCIVVLVLALILFIGGVLYQSIIRYPIRTHGRLYCFVVRCMNELRGGYHRMVSRLGAFTIEVYKLLILQRGWLVIAIALFLFLSGYPKRNIYYAGVEQYMKMFYAEWSGENNEELEAYVDSVRTRLESVEQEYMAALLDYEAGLISGEELQNKQTKYEAYHVQREGLARIEEAFSYMEKQKKEGYEVWLVNPLGYEKLLTMDETDYVMQFGVVLAIILIAAGTFPFERKCGVADLNRTTPHGREWLVIRKSGAVVLLSILLFGMFHVVRTMRVIQNYGLDTLQAPARSLSVFADCPFSWNIGTVLAVTALLQMTVMIGIAMLVVLLSTYCSYEVTVALSVGVLIVPGVLQMTGILGEKVWSLQTVLRRMCLIIWEGTYGSRFLWVMLVLIAAAIGTVQLWSRRRVS